MIIKLKKHISKTLNVPNKRLSYVILNGGVTRAREAHRNVALFYDKTKPLCVARWYTGETNRLEQERDCLAEFHGSGAAVPKLIELAEVDKTKVLIEEFLAGSDLNALVARRMLSAEDAIKVARNVFDKLEQKTSKSSKKDLMRRELDEVLLFGTSNQVLSNDTSRQIREVLDEHFLAKKQFNTSLVHGDLTLKNIMQVEAEPYAFDFEFATRTHFAFSDWFRLWMHSPELCQQQMLQHAAPGTVKSIVSDTNVLRHALAFYELLSCRIKLDVYPNYLRQPVIAETSTAINNRLTDDEFLFPTKVDSDSVEGPSDDFFAERYRQTVEQMGDVQTKYKSTQLALSNRNAKYSELDASCQQLNDKVRELRLELNFETKKNEQLKARLTATEAWLHAAEHKLHHTSLHANQLQNQNADLHNLLCQKDQTLNNIINSIAFKLARSVTTTVKRIPGSERLRSVIRS